jgi:cytochrome c556
MSRLAFTLLGAAIIAAVGAGTVMAQSDPIAERKALMKSVGGATGRVSAMLKGDAPYDAAKATEALNTYIEVSKNMPALYPDTSKTGGETSAAPKIWEDKAGFQAGFVKFEADAKGALDKTADLATFRAAFGDVAKNCGSCHQSYRITR